MVVHWVNWTKKRLAPVTFTDKLPDCTTVGWWVPTRFTELLNPIRKHRWLSLQVKHKSAKRKWQFSRSLCWISVSRGIPKDCVHALKPDVLHDERNFLWLSISNLIIPKICLPFEKTLVPKRPFSKGVWENNRQYSWNGANQYQPVVSFVNVSLLFHSPHGKDQKNTTVCLRGEVCPRAYEYE